MSIDQNNNDNQINLFSNVSTNDDINTRGTGFYVNDEHIVTDWHAVYGCKKIKIHKNDKVGDASVVAHDKSLDIAILKSTLKSKDYVYMEKKVTKQWDKAFFVEYVYGDFMTQKTTVTHPYKSVKKISNDGKNKSIIHSLMLRHGIPSLNKGGAILSGTGGLIGMLYHHDHDYNLDNSRIRLAEGNSKSAALHAKYIKKLLDKSGITYYSSVGYKNYNSLELDDKVKSFSVRLSCTN